MQGGPMLFRRSRWQFVFSTLHSFRLKQGWRFPAVCASFLLMLLGAAQGQQCSNAQFVQRVYSDLLFRQPTASEITFYALAVQSNGRQPVALSLIGSQEFNFDLIGANPSVVSGFFQAFLGRNPTVTEAQFFLAL